MILRTETRHRVDSGGHSGHDEAALVINIIASRPHLTQVYSAARLMWAMSHPCPIMFGAAIKLKPQSQQEAAGVPNCELKQRASVEMRYILSIINIGLFLNGHELR